MALEASTLLFIGIFVRLTAAGVALLAWYHHREVVCLLGWSLAMALSALAMAVGSLRGADNALDVTLLTNVLFVVGYALMWTSMRRFNDSRVRPINQLIGVLMVAGAFVALFALAWWFGAPRRALSALFSLFVAGLTLAAAWETWRGFGRDGLGSRHIAGTALACIAATRLIRVTLIGLQMTGAVSPATGELVQSFTLYFNIAFLLAATFGLILMAQEWVDGRSAQTDIRMPS
ncbi:MAG: hypothetical protein PSV46_10850 [Reyranella sp.]|nr:hypothetical protein [Reyranella sp.]